MARWFCLACVIFALPALGGEVEAVGRLENATTGGSCSAVLVEDDVILTAAHCFRRNDSAFRFRPGDGQPGGATYPVIRLFSHPLYETTQARPLWALRFDLAIARLASPIPTARAIPIAPGGTAQIGERLFIVSWRGDGSERPRQRACPVIEGVQGLVTLSCRVRSGESGAPVLRKTEAGLEVVAIISSQARIMEQPIAQASDVKLRLPPLLDLINQP